MRVADVQLSFPAILIALLIDGVARAAVPRELHEVIAFPVLVGAIALAGWPQYARTVRGSTLVEKNREYVQAARVIGVASPVIMFRHVLPNVLGPVLVLATVHLATAIITEATLSFLGVGVPPTSPSLGTLIRIGNDFLFSGEWWIVIFPGLALVLLVLSVNLLVTGCATRSTPPDVMWPTPALRASPQGHACGPAKPAAASMEPSTLRGGMSRQYVDN